MEPRIQYSHDDGISRIDLDDGKVNVMSPGMQKEILGAFDRAEDDDAVVVMRGRPGVFSAGFDLAVLRGDPRKSFEMVLGGFAVAHRILGYERPVLIACTGHAIAMGSFIVLSGDYRIAPVGSARIVANEVSIGLTVPHAATEILRQRLTPAAFQRATLLSESFDPEGAVKVGFLDEVVAEDRFDGRVDELAHAFAQLGRDAQRATKRRTREPLLATLQAAIDRDRDEFEDLLSGLGSADS